MLSADAEHPLLHFAVLQWAANAAALCGYHLHHHLLG